MSNGIVLSPCNAITKTRNAILRMKKCSPELRTVLRERCQERIQNDRTKILNKLRKIKIQDSFRAAFGNILCEEWKKIDETEITEVSTKTSLPNSCEGEFNLDDELLLEEQLEKELLLDHEDWLLQQYENLLSEEISESNEVVCPLCCIGFLEPINSDDCKTVICSKCPARFNIERPLLDFQAAIYESLALHDSQCNCNAGFVNVPINSSQNNLCVICHHCSFSSIIL